MKAIVKIVKLVEIEIDDKYKNINDQYCELFDDLKKDVENAIGMPWHRVCSKEPKEYFVSVQGENFYLD
jgi:hypothetical protein